MCVSRPAVPFRPKPEPICGQIRKNLFTMTKSLASTEATPSTIDRRQGKFHFPTNEQVAPCDQPAGGASRDRTDDLKLAKLALSQLSYGPVLPERVVGPGGFEPPTPRLSSVCSNQLSYRPLWEGLFVRGRDAETATAVCEGKSRRFVSKPSGSSLKGGDPAAGSPTATLLRLHPSR